MQQVYGKAVMQSSTQMYVLDVENAKKAVQQEVLRY